MKYGKHHVIKVLIAVLAILLCLSFYATRNTLEHTFYDIRVRLVQELGLGHSATSGQVVVVGIDESSIIGEKPLLFIYDDIGRFLRRMDEYGAGTVGLDIIMVHKQSEKLKDAAVAFTAGDAQNSKRYGELMGEIGERLDRSVLEPIMDVSERLRIVQVTHGDLVPFYYGVSPLIKNMTIADAVLTDGDLRHNDGVIRRQTLGTGEKKTFAGVLYSLVKGHEYVGDRVLLNYSLSGSIPFYCFDDIMNGKIDRSSFKGKTVILGYISGYEDIHPTPLNRPVLPSRISGKGTSTQSRSTGTRMPGPVIHGIIAETMLTGTSLREAPPAVNVIILIILAGISLAAVYRFKPFIAIALAVAVAAAFFAVNLLSFSAGYYLHLFPQAIAPLAVIILIYPYRYFVEEGMRRKVRKVFSYYIDENVLDRLLETENASLLNGEARNICILFLDIRNFTMLSTKRRAEDVVRFLNFFFGNITEIIQRHGGFVNKFIGDGILAFFATGKTPVADAIRAAGDILAETKKLNGEDRFREFIGDWEVNVGIGIHYGEVILGNIGSLRKMDFTIIGEHVNIASRIEGLTKEAGVGLLISSDAKDIAGEAFKYRLLGEFSVKGVEHPLSLYTIEEF